MKWKIGDVSINNQVCLAPMAGIGNSAFRTIIKEFGCGLIYTEMISDKAIVYNGRQSTGLVTINTDTGFNRSQKLGEVVASRKEGVWRINNIRDCVISSNMSIFTKDWNSIKASYPIDKVVNGSATSFSKPWSSLERFRDRYVIARLIDSNVDNTINTVVHFITEESGASIR